MWVSSTVTSGACPERLRGGQKSNLVGFGKFDGRSGSRHFIGSLSEEVAKLDGGQGPQSRSMRLALPCALDLCPDLGRKPLECRAELDRIGLIGRRQCRTRESSEWLIRLEISKLIEPLILVKRTGTRLDTIAN